MKNQPNQRPRKYVFANGLAQLATQFAAVMASSAASTSGLSDIRSANHYAQWRGTPIGTSNMSPAIHRRQMKKKKAVKRARRLGHA